MAYAMMWMEWLAAAILFVVVVTACVGRLRSRAVQFILAAVAALVPVGKGAVAAAVFGWIAMVTLRPWYTFHWFLFWLSWAVCVAIGSAAVLVAGLRRRGAEPAPQAASWPRGKLALGLVAVLLLGWITFWNLDLSVKGRLASLRVEAGALALSAAPARPLDAENAATVYRQAFDAMLKGDDVPPEYSEKWISWIGEAGEADFDPADAKLAAFLDRNEAAMGLLRRAAEMPACYFDHDYGRPSISMLLPEMSQFQNAARVLAMDARVKTAAGKTDRAVEDVRAVFGLARHSAANPILISLLVAINADEIGVHALEALLGGRGPAAGQLARLRLSEPGLFESSLPRALRMEEAFALSAISDISLGDDPSAVDHLGLGMGGALGRTAAEPIIACWRVFLATEEVAAYRGGMHEFQRLAAMPYYETAGDWERTNQPESIRRRGIMASMMMPALGRCAVVVARGDARHALAYVAVAAARYRAEKGRLPETLEALVPDYLPAVPRDPFDGKPVKRVARGGAVVFYSVGQDLKDDGGTRFDDEKRTGDLTFSLGAAGAEKR
ncbi:MAG: hypothetical protein IMZ44_04810 [Planctomycetes bacterium]|nr:hypothetical protein [Planctomycetota bacterium]